MDNKDSENSTKPVSKDENLKKDVIERPDLSQKEQASAHKEAKEVVREKLVKSGYDCSGWILDNEVNDGKWHSYNQIEGKSKILMEFLLMSWLKVLKAVTYILAQQTSSS